jgi:hypothetical protein
MNWVSWPSEQSHLPTAHPSILYERLPCSAIKEGINRLCQVFYSSLWKAPGGSCMMADTLISALTSLSSPSSIARDATRKRWNHDVGFRKFYRLILAQTSAMVSQSPEDCSLDEALPQLCAHSGRRASRQDMMIPPARFVPYSSRFLHEQPHHGLPQYPCSLRTGRW